MPQSDRKPNKDCKKFLKDEEIMEIKIIAEKQARTLNLPSSLFFPTQQVTSYYLKVKYKF